MVNAFVFEQYYIKNDRKNYQLTKKNW